MIPRVHIIGRKNSGKTTLVVELIEYFVGQDIAVGSIKHTHHRHELDVPGKDSFRHRQAGASPVAILSPGMTAVFRPRPAGLEAKDYTLVEPMFAGCRLILVEGDSQADAPKVEVWRAATGTAPMAGEFPGIHAVITDDPGTFPATVWPRADVGQLAQRILDLITP